MTALRHNPERSFSFFCHTRDGVLTVKTCNAELSGNLCDSVFMFGGISNWKDATVGYTKHQLSSRNCTSAL